MNPFYQSFQQNSGGSSYQPRSGLDQFLYSIGSQISRPGMNPNMIMRQLEESAKNMVLQLGVTPEQIVRQKIQNGEMTQQQFDYLRQQANKVTGRNY